MLNKKIDAEIKRYLQVTPEEERSYGWVREGKIMPGWFRFMPILGWIADPPEDAPPGAPKKVLFSGALLGVLNDNFVGSLDWSIPLVPRTEDIILQMLAAFGWDKRIWPDDEGWPDGSPEERDGMYRMMDKKQLGATMTFPPGPKGNDVILINVLKVSSPFPLPPCLRDAERVAPSPELIERFRELCDAAGFKP